MFIGGVRCFSWPESCLDDSSSQIFKQDEFTLNLNSNPKIPAVPADLVSKSFEVKPYFI